MPASIDILRVNVLTAVTMYLKSVLPASCEVIKGQVNRVPEPTGDDWVSVTAILFRPLATSEVTYFGPAPTVLEIGKRTDMVASQITFQLDFHGPGSGDNSAIIETLFRTEQATDFFDSLTFIQNTLGAAAMEAVAGAGGAIGASSPVPVSPLYCSEARQTPFINGEMEYEDSWSIDLELEYNPTVTTGQDFAASINITLVNVDAPPYPISF